jgi:hypothetical protein
MKQPLTAFDYQRLFVDHQLGRDVFAALTAKFGRAGFIKGSDEANRQMIYDAGQKSVIDFIQTMITYANGHTNE